MQRIAREVDDDLLKGSAKDSLSRQSGQAPMQLWWKPDVHGLVGHGSASSPTRGGIYSSPTTLRRLRSVVVSPCSRT